MAAYNEERYIAEAIQSILGQSFTDFEFIIINDGSTDSTEQIITSFKDPRIRYIKNEQNLRLIASLNKGIGLAKGRYVARMDADDISMPDRLKEQVLFMEANPDVGLSGAQLEVFGKETGTMQYPLDHEAIKLHLLITSAFGNNVVIFRKALQEKYNLWFESGYLHAEDYKCWTQWIRHTRVHNLASCLVRYRSHANSMSVKHRQVQRDTRNRIRGEYLVELFDFAEARQAAKALAGKTSAKKISALLYFLKKNAALQIFDQLQLKKTFCKLWYLDCLEQAEESSLSFWKFPLIFKISFAGNLLNWPRVLKHHIKFGRKQKPKPDEKK
jgi:glycosyltransferase involved in cell wall biosynthesis